MNSYCKSHLWMHRFKPSPRVFEDGIEEICERCGISKFFRNIDPSEEYMSWNMRRALHPDRDINFEIEYAR